MTTNDESIPRERLIRIYSDSNNRDEQGRYFLNYSQSLADMEPYKDVLRPGMRVLINVMDELEFEAILVFNDIWLADEIGGTLRYLDEPSTEVP